MRTLIYKRTHHGDPDPRTGEFGCSNCMGSVRGWKFDAVIGIGGLGAESKRNGIASRLTWIGIGPRKFHDPDRPNSPRVKFDHFWYQGERGPLLEQRYPALARRMYDRNVRIHLHSAPEAPELDRDVGKILRLAMAAPPSNKSANRVSTRKCAPKSGVGRTATGC
jgi:hypothetical protein